MNVGLLWFDNDPRRDLKEKITRAAKHYRKKHGIPPNVCHVHKSALSDNGKTTKIGQIRVEASPTALLHHLWLGQEEQP
jgi:hypothetical protein